MSGVHQKTILARRRAEELVGRTDELDTLMKHAKGASGSGGLFLLSRPGAGASELLLQTFDQLFFEFGDVIPIYFAVDRRDRDVSRTALRFAREFLAQAVAFGRKEPGIVFASPGFAELSRLAAPRDIGWIDDIIEGCGNLDASADPRSLVKSCFSMPLRATGKKVFVMLDALHESTYLYDSEGFINSIKEYWRTADFPFVFSAHRRFFGTDFEFPRMLLEPPDLGEAGELAEKLGAKYGVAINDQTRDLIATQFDGRPGFIDAVIRRAHVENIPLDSFPNVQRGYAEELFAGGIGAYFDDVIAAASPSNEAGQNLVGLLFDSFDHETPLLPVEKWRRRIGIEQTELHRMLGVLNVDEVIRLTSNRVETMRENTIFGDYIRGRFRLEIAGENRALVVGEELSHFTTRAPELMARSYRLASALDLRELLSSFERRSVPLALLDYAAFKEKYKGLPEGEVASGLRRDDDIISLPKIVFTAQTEMFYSAIRDHIDAERSAVGIGFREGSYAESDETVWLAAEIDSKVEAAADIAEFWCDRLETAALMCDFPNYRIWIIAPEGFTPEALEIISQRNGFGSSRRQAELLAEHLGAEPVAETPAAGNEYEITIPMGEDAELVAAHTLEDIARKHGFKSNVINQIKTAVVEACINASEHSHSPDGQIRLSFNVAGDRINISVANRGIRLTDHEPADPSDEARRGWGLKLMERLMDDVNIEQTDDGTRISMTKLLEAA